MAPTVTTRVLPLAFLWVLILFGTLAIIKNRLGDSRDSSEQKGLNSKIGRVGDFCGFMLHQIFCL